VPDEFIPNTPEGESPSADVQGAPEVSDSFTNINPNDLPPELQGMYKNMQADYTRKTQEIAPYRQLGDIDQVQQAIGFLDALANDPQTQYQLYSALNQHLGGIGLIEEQGNANVPTPGAEFTEPEYGLDDDEYTDPHIAELERRVQELDQWRNVQLQTQQQEQAYSQIGDYLSNQEQNIRQSNPAYKQEDMDAIYHLGHATQGDLFAAQKMYEEMKQRVMGSYLDQKGSVPAGVSPPSATGHGQQPHGFTDLYDPQLDAAVQAYVRSTMQ